MSTMPSKIFRLIQGGGRSDQPITKVIKVINYGWITVGASVLLTLIGIYAIDLGLSRPDEHGTMVMSSTAIKQMIFMAIGLVACFVIALPHYKLVSGFAWLLFIVCLGLLVFLLIPGIPKSIVTPRNGARSWINLGFTDFQPSEVMKIAFVLAVAQYMRFRSEHRRFKGLIVPGIIAAVPVALITVQPDLGTASLFIPALFAMLIAAGARLRHLTLIVLCAAMAAPVGYQFMKPHQKARIDGLVKQFQGDTSTNFDINFQAYRAQMLIGAGQATGMNDETTRAMVRYNALPERENDMIFAVVVARFGFVGGFVPLVLYAVWVGGAFVVAASCREPMGRLIAVGIPAFIATQVVINVGMNIGVVPIIGITLPFLSAGGSSLITSWLMTGL
ncbi:MAG: FtsW/RodA/SpoVE family cell cycle protein, partial [Phycisphaerales bacterium]|nr:FtsW/RodA/SpoVE family cell cycle protein [Phycisphaerales bacterium]